MLDLFKRLICAVHVYRNTDMAWVSAWTIFNPDSDEGPVSQAEDVWIQQ